MKKERGSLLSKIPYWYFYKTTPQNSICLLKMIYVPQNTTPFLEHILKSKYLWKTKTIYIISDYYAFI